MSPLENLISRLEEAFEEDSELDLLIAQAVGNTSRPAPTYTGSIDAAMTLVPSGYAISLHVDANLTVHAGCELDEGEGCSDAQPCGDTPALALCIVALRARSALPSQERQG
jgi:hypothetical protein